MRKTKKCDRTSLRMQGGRLTIRVCFMTRGHSGHEHHDSMGAWFEETAEMINHG